MRKNNTKKVAEKIADMMSDSRLTLSDWKFVIPMYLLQEPDNVMIVSKNLADGIDYQMDRHGLDIPAEFVVSYSEDTLKNIQGKEYRGQ